MVLSHDLEPVWAPSSLSSWFQLCLSGISHNIGPFLSGGDFFVGKFWVPDYIQPLLYFLLSSPLAAIADFLTIPICILGFRGIP